MADSPPIDPAAWIRTLGEAQVDFVTQAIDAMGGGQGAGVADFWRQGLQAWSSLLSPAVVQPVAPSTDKRFSDPAWDQPPFAQMRQAYETATTQLMAGVDQVQGLDDAGRERLRFSARLLADAMSPSNFPWTNPQVLQRMAATGGDSLIQGMTNMLNDLGKGQLTHVATNAFEVGRNLATTPGKVVRRTPLYELIQYSPATDTVGMVPLVIFPPWINRFYILDLTPEKSFIRWAVARGLTVFMVSWKSADASMKHIAWDDYVSAQIEAVDTIRSLLSVEAAHTIGYCVAGTTLAATLAVLTARGMADKVKSATFFTAQVDFAGAGDLKHFTDDDQLALFENLSPDGFLDGRYMAAAFNALRGRDLIWNYVTNNYLLGESYKAFDLLHWNGDTTNLPARWHQNYLKDLYRDNRLVQPGSLSIDGTPLDLTQVETPTYVQAGREDHIAPAESVWKITQLFRGPLKFVLAGSGHIAGVVNPPQTGKYQYWTNAGPVATLAEFIAGATETRGSWWPDWLAWLTAQDDRRIPADGARVPGGGALKALGEAPGEYVRQR